MQKADLKRAAELSKAVAKLGRIKYAPPSKAPIGRPKTYLNRPIPVPKAYMVRQTVSIAPTAEELLAIIEPVVRHHVGQLDLPKLEITREVVKEIIGVMHALPENDKLEVSKGIRNASSFIYNGTKYGTHELMHGGSSANSTAVSVYGEVVAGSGNNWTLGTTPTAGTLRLFANGQRLALTTDYTLVGAAITTISPWAALTLLADYNA